MKRILLALVLIGVISCQQIDLQYSCDPSINQIVVENLEEFSKIDVFELTSYDIYLQKAIFNSWDYVKKRDAWIEKLNYVLANEEFDEKEIEHIHKLIEHIEPNYFSEEFLRLNSKEILQFADE